MVSKYKPYCTFVKMELICQKLNNLCFIISMFLSFQTKKFLNDHIMSDDRHPNQIVPNQIFDEIFRIWEARQIHTMIMIIICEVFDE